MTSPSRDEALRAMQQALCHGVTELDALTGTLNEIAALFASGAVTGSAGDRWQAQVQRILPFVAQIQATLRALADQARPAS